MLHQPFLQPTYDHLRAHSIDRRRNFSKTRVNEREGDITYINQKNKQFNDKLGRFYNRYTTEIRENFERGTAI